MSNLIRRACHSRFSHVDIILPGEGLLGVSGEDKALADPGGVRIRPFEPWPYNIVREVTVPTDRVEQIITAARSQIGKPFDNEALYAFFNPYGAHRDWQEQSKWFCSEFVIWACKEGGLFGYEICAPMNMINPNDVMLLLNAYMPDYDILELLKGD